MIGVIIAVAACAHGSAPRGAPAATDAASSSTSSAASSTVVDPVGVYSYASTANGQDITGTITVTRAPGGAYEATMTTGVTREIVFDKVSVTGNRLAMETTPPSARVTVALTLDGTAIRGTWQMGALNGPIRGQRVR